MSKQLGLDKFGVQKVMYPKDYACDAVGQFAMNVVTLLTGQLTYFYTEKVGVAAATAGTILLIAKIFDAITDIIFGKMLTHTKSKYGKARPWLLRMLFPTMVGIIALFTMPHLSQTGMMIYGIITNIFISAICYTSIMGAYNAVLAYTTRSIEEQGKMGVFRCAVGYAVGIGLGIGLIPITNMMGGDQKAWIIFVSVLAVLSGIALFIVFKTSVERFGESEEEQAEEEGISVWEALKILAHNKYWIKMTISGVCINIVYAMIMAAPTYYCRYIMGNDNLIAMVNTVNIIPTVLGVLTSPILIQKLGLTKTMKYACLLGVVAEAVRCVSPANWMMTLVFNAVTMYATVPMISALQAMIINTAEINMDQYGVRMIPMTNSANSFAGKIGNGVGSAFIGWVLAVGGYNADLKVQPASVTTSIYALNIYIPMAMLFIVFLLLLRYDLDERYESLLASNAKKSEEKKMAAAKK